MRSERESEKLEDEGSIPSRPTKGLTNLTICGVLHGSTVIKKLLAK